MATFVTLCCSYGVWYSYSVFLVALLREFGWSRSLVAGAFSIFTLVHGLSSAPLGWLLDRYGPRRLVTLGGAILGLGLVLDGAVERPWQLYAAYGVVTAVGVACAGWMPAVVLVQRAYPQRVGTMLGVASAGIGVGIFLMAPLAQWLIEVAGWRWAFRLLAGAAVAWIVPATLVLVTDPPRDAAAVPAAPAGARPPGPGEASLRTAVRDARFWLLAVVLMGSSFVNQMLLVHQVAYLVDHRVEAFVAASVVGLIGVVSVLAKAGGGWCSDRLGRELTYTAGAVCLSASLLALGGLALWPGPGWAWLYAVLIGIGYSITGPLAPALVSDHFRGRHFGAIFGALHVSNALGGSLGPWIAGRVFDATHSYAPAFALAGAAVWLATAASWLARALGRRPAAPAPH